NYVAERAPLWIGAAIIRRDAFETEGGFDQDLNGATDWELWMRLAARYTFAYYDRPAAIHERHAGNMSNNVDHMRGDAVKALGKILNKSLPVSADDLDLVRAHRTRLMAGWAYDAFERGDLGLARNRFADYMHEFGIRPGPLFYWSCSWLD